MQGRALRILYNNSTSDYNKLLCKPYKGSMEAKSLRHLGLEIVESLYHLTTEYMKESFHKTINLTHRSLDIKVNLNKVKIR